MSRGILSNLLEVVKTGVFGAEMGGVFFVFLPQMGAFFHYFTEETNLLLSFWTAKGTIEDVEFFEWLMVIPVL